jgi:transcriptional regulator with XRE-family HTH domain
VVIQLYKPANNIFKERLAHLREERNLKQKEFAEAINIHNRNINRYELGLREPDFDTLIKIADFFNVSTDYLLGRTENRKRL